jgi:hypothetical protein
MSGMMKKLTLFEMPVFSRMGAHDVQPSAALPAGGVRLQAVSIRKLAVRFTRRLLATFSLEVRRTPPQGAAPDPAPLCEDFLEALFRERGGEAGAFLCQTSRCVQVNGFSLAPAAWHPLRETLREALESGQSRFEGSVLDRFYAAWRPQNAGQTFPGFGEAPESFNGLPPACVHLLPWMAWSPAQAERYHIEWNLSDWKEHGAVHLDPRRDGLPDFGPVSRHLGQFEYARLRTLHESLERDGYRRELGDVRVQVLCRGNDVRFLHYGGGRHRTVAMNVLGHDMIPARHTYPWLIDVDQAADWPGVRSGLWNERQARAYVDYLFEFDSQAWAKAAGLVV